ncbi:MAG: peroxide stress protein YaaA [Paracoccaceae bacterium]
MHPVKNGGITVSFWAKKARGAMARFIVEHRLTDPTDLRGFDARGYVFDAGASTPARPVFRGDVPEPARA